MRPVVRAALFAAGLAAIAQVASWLNDAEPAHQVAAPTESASAALLGQCPPGTLPDGRACIPVPESPAEPGDLPASPAVRDETIPRRPDRPESYARYDWPVALSPAGVLSPDAGASGSLAIPQQRGVEVRARKLVHQVGDAEVLAITDLVGNTVATLHTLRHPGGLRQYVVLYGGLGEIDPGLKRGANVAPGAVLGKVGDSAVPGDVHLYVEVRQIRRNVDPRALPIAELRKSARTVACDPRNVFPLR
jgi:murein DD-endopeptidase MepM/ murein hydrolase activator NlpD